MDLIIINAEWMFYNFLLALIGVIFGWIFFKIKHSLLKAIFFLLWLLFVPNTIYILTDVIHLPNQISQIEGSVKILLVIQYFILLSSGIVTYMYALYPFEKWLIKSKLRLKKSQITLSLIALNFLIALAVTMGRFQRTNSWEVVTNTEKVVNDAISVLTSQELLLYAFGFTILFSVIYSYGKQKFLPLFFFVRKNLMYSRIW